MNKVIVWPIEYNIVAGNVPGGYVAELQESQGKIIIAPDISEQARNVSMLHEIIHAILNHNGMSIDEATMETLSYGLYGVLRDNPELIAEILR